MIWDPIDDAARMPISITLRASWAIASGVMRLLAALRPDPAPSGGSPGGVNLNIKPDPGGLPGSEAFNKVVGGLMSYGLLAALAGAVISAMVLGAGRWFGNSYASSTGRMGVFASLAAALIIGGAGKLVEWAFNIGTGF
ncbi:DUF6112 family protein [Streptosporangium canum]|uniref:DUF6112 family protein n=1 Tax=Streptosporangium canum TaxID=324952 RepID=UPI003794E89E